MSAGALYFIRDELRPEFEDELRYLKHKTHELAPGVFYSEGAVRLYWVLDYWPVEALNFQSIKEAANQLRQIAKFWAYAGSLHYRRGQLIAEELRARSPKPVAFPVPAGRQRAAAFTLKDTNTLLYSETPLKGRFAGGVVRFIEDKLGPPSRAYLKLWEVLALAGMSLDTTDQAIDLGATPGGWSYVAASLGAAVLMVDRSEPDAKLLRQFKKLRFLRGDGLNPPEDELQQASFIMSDMACEPQKLFQAVQRWLLLDNVRAMVCTLKFHGISDKALIREFAAIRGSEIYHLYHNGHELTWLWQRPR